MTKAAATPANDNPMPVLSDTEQALQNLAVAGRAYIGTAADHRAIRLGLERLRARCNSDEDQLTEEHPTPLFAMQCMKGLVDKTQANAQSHEALEAAIALLAQRTLGAADYELLMGKPKPTAGNRKVRRADAAQSRTGKSLPSPKARKR